MNHAITDCRSCETRLACSRAGCIELRDGGQSIDTAAAGATGFVPFPAPTDETPTGWLARLRAWAAALLA